jgi:hypothetical protein
MGSLSKSIGQRITVDSVITTEIHTPLEGTIDLRSRSESRPALTSYNWSKGRRMVGSREAHLLPTFTG